MTSGALRVFLLACLLVLAPTFSTAQGGDWLERLRDGHHVLLMRHAYAPGVGDPPGYSLERCETQRRLDDEGRRQATRIGHWLRAQGIAEAEVYASPWCRCRETAERLQLGPVRIETSLGSFFTQPGLEEIQTRRLQAFIARTLASRQGPTGAKARPLILVTHQVNITALTGQTIGTGDMVLVRVDSQGRMVESHRLASP